MTMNSDPRDYRLDITGLSTPPSESRATGRRYLSVRFDCCSVYARIYLAKDGKAYTGACPRCGQRVNFPVGPGGTDARFFVVK